MKTAIAFNRLVVLFNPSGTNAVRADKIVQGLERTFPGKVVVEKTTRSKADTVSALKQRLQPSDIILPCGGDGTLNSVAAALLDPTMPNELKNTPVLPVGTGRANDIARTVNGKHYADPVFVLEHGYKMPVHPLLCTFTPLEGGEPVFWLAMYQLGLGISGKFTELLNDPEFRAKQRKQTLPVREVEVFRAGIQTVKDAPYFELTLHGQRQKAVDLTFVNGPIFASYYRTPVQLSQKEFCYTISTDKSLSYTARTIFELMTNTYDKWNVANNLSFTLHQSTVAHADGECIDIPTPCEVAVTHSEETIVMLAANTPTLKDYLDIKFLTGKDTSS